MSIKGQPMIVKLNNCARETAITRHHSTTTPTTGKNRRYFSRMAKRNIIVGILYRSPNSSISACNDKFDKMLSTIQEDKKYVYVNTLD